MIAESEYYWVDVPGWYTPIANVPIWWDNFETHCNEIYANYQSSGGNWHLHTIMNYELKPYGGKYKHRNTQSSIRFNNESGFIIFVLRWS
jgi:hypothetical protein